MKRRREMRESVACMHSVYVDAARRQNRKDRKVT